MASALQMQMMLLCVYGSEAGSMPTLMSMESAECRPDEDSEEQVGGICDAVWESGVDVGNTTKWKYDLLPADYNLPAKEAAVLLEQGVYSGPNCLRGLWRLREDIEGCWMGKRSDGRRSLHQQKRMTTAHEEIRTETSPFAFKRPSNVIPKNSNPTHQKPRPNQSPNLLSKSHHATTPFLLTKHSPISPLLCRHAHQPITPYHPVRTLE